jgi:putative FmdB family regulatory protein
MPLYEYACGEHGVFEAHRPIAEFDASSACPLCERACARVLSAPRVRLVGAFERVARDRNERSRHEPKLVTRESRGPTRDGPPTFHSSGSLPWAVSH